MAGIDSYTVSCLHFQNRVWTFNGTAQIDTAQKKFGGASLLLDGTGDYLSTPDSADFDFGTGEFTIDFWVRRDGTQDDYAGVISGCKSDDTGWSINFGDASGGTQNKIRLVSNASGSFQVDVAGTDAIADATWTHVAFVRSGNTLTIYQGGVPVDTLDVTGFTYNCAGTGAVIGRYYTDSDSLYYQGWLDEVRITKGLARWTADFSASLPSAQYSDDANTVSLLHFNEPDGSTFTKDVAANWAMDAQAQFYDESGKVWTAYGNAQLDTAQYKWTASGLFDGIGDYISAADSADWDFGTGDFTIDFWVRRNGDINDYGGVISGTSNADNGWNMSFGSTAGSSKNKLRFNHPSGSWGVKIVSSTVLPDTTWTHIALVRYGNTITMYQAGTSVGSVDCTGWTVDCSGTGVVIGRYYTNADSDYFNGQIDELRISKGIARWTSNFTPPTEEYTASGNIYYLPALTDTDSALAPSINHVFPIPATDADSFLVPSINHVFPIPISDTDTMVAPKYNIVLKMPVYLTDSDTVVAPYFGRTIPLTSTLTDTDIPLSLRIEGIPVPRHRVKVNY